MSEVSPRPLHIAFLLTQSLESPHGLGRSGPLARSLVRRGHRVEIYALHPSYNKEIGQTFEQEGVRITYVGPMHVRKDGNRKSYYSPAGLIKVAASASQRLTLAALRTRASILYVCKPHPMNGIAGLLGKWLGRKALFVDCDDYEAATNVFGADWQKSIVAGFERQIPRRALGVTIHSQFMMEKLVEWGVKPDHILYLPNGVEPGRFPKIPNEQILALRSRLGLMNKHVLAYIGSLSLASHPVDLLLQAFARVQKKAPDSVLLLVGGGEDYDALQNQVAVLGLGQKVVFTGRVDPQEVGAYYRVADVTVDPVRDDDVARGRSPIKMIESWMCSTPFVTADIGDRRRLMGDPPAGVLTSPGDPSSLADAILQIIQQPQFAESLRSIGQERVRSFYWDVLAKDLEQFYYRFM